MKLAKRHFSLNTRHLLALPSQLLFVNIIDPDTFYDLEDLITDIELVIKLCVSSGGLALNVELHQGMKKVLVGKFRTHERITENTLL